MTPASWRGVLTVLELRDVTYRYGGQPVLAGIDLRVPQGQLVSLLGPSGLGKSTLLRLLAGVEVSSAGAVRFGGAAVRAPSVQRGIVFQDSSSLATDGIVAPL
jgi:ABC-type nitrate/sulfonate/bicarbonate transport system ATPase subunit